MLKRFFPVRLFICFLFGPFMCMAQSMTDSQLPKILPSENAGYSLQVDGKPFLVLGAQLWNSSSWPYILDRTWPLLKSMHCNTLEAPVYWQVVEPRPGSFRFDEVDSLVYGARKQGLRLILLWFGTFKNGSSSYAPAWLLDKPEQFPRVQNKQGEEMTILSTLSEVNLNADKNAFVSLMKHLKVIDGRDHTVIMVQVENEAGSFGTDRDYSPAANKLFDAPVPDSLVQGLSKKAGTWKEVFGNNAAESFSAYTVARYINEIAGAGQKEYALPMYVNCWLRENGFQRPGEYPSGGPTSNMLVLWKLTAPSISFLAPDIYQSNSTVFRNICAVYQHPVNPLFIPEMGKGTDFARFQFYAVGDYHAMGIATYGIDFFLTDPNDQRSKDVLDPRFSEMAANYQLFAAAMPAIVRLQKEDKLAAAVEEYGLREQLISMGNYEFLFSFGFPVYKTNKEPIGRVLIGQTGEDEFLLMGFNAKFQIRPKFGSGYQTTEMLMIEEGEFVDSKWVRKRLWNGDEAYHSTLGSEGNILKITLRRNNPVK
jgi:Domain of unknown function (DUF5597)/Glycosyl hydrolases family 35